MALYLPTYLAQAERTEETIPTSSPEMFVPKYSSSALLVGLLSAAALPATSAFTVPGRGTPSTICHGRNNAHAPIDSSLASSTDVVLAEDVSDEPSSEKTSAPAAASRNEKKRLAVLLCPAQFCVPVDYTDLLDAIRSEHSDVEVVAARVAPLPRTEWIKVARQLPTKDFIDANLSVKVTLDWYFEAIEQGLAELFAEGGEDVDVCVIGHSIGGWVARAYLGGLSG